MRQYIFILFISWLCTEKLVAQVNTQPQVGKPMPNFTLDNIKYYRTTSASLQDFKGKWLFLDFWFTGCTSCIQSFPKINKIQQMYPNDIQYMLVGVNEKKRFLGDGIEKVYEKMRKQLGLQLASAYDSVLNNRWGITSMPYIIIVDPNGIVRHITNGSNMSVEKVDKLIRGEPVSFTPIVTSLAEFDVTKFPGSENDKLVYRSILTRSNGERSTRTNLKEYVNWPDEYRKRGIKVTSAGLATLYKLAYYGENRCSAIDAGDGMFFYPEVILEMQDKSPFYPNKDLSEFEGLYSYNLSVRLPRSNDLEYIKSVFQQELQLAFGYEAKMEKREMPIWKLVAQPEAGKKLKTKGDKQYVSDGTGSGAIPVGFTAVNISPKTLLNLVSYYVDCNQPPFFDETGINYNIDIVISANMNDLEDIRRSLNKNGLDLVRGSKQFWVLVIGDAGK